MTEKFELTNSHTSESEKERLRVEIDEEFKKYAKEEYAALRKDFLELSQLGLATVVTGVV